MAVCPCLNFFLEQGGSHPGHLMIDSIQKGLGRRTAAQGVADRYSDPAIVDRLYSHIRGFARDRKGDAQLIIVDNSPPDSHRDLIAVEFTRDPAQTAVRAHRRRHSSARLRGDDR